MSLTKRDNYLTREIGFSRNSMKVIHFPQIPVPANPKLARLNFKILKAGSYYS